MRYISKNGNLKLLSNDGKVRQSFKNGVLLVGSGTTNVGAGNYIPTDYVETDAYGTTVTRELLALHSTDILGNGTDELEMAGLGTLNAVTHAGSAVSNVLDGIDGRQFFEAPTLTGTTDAVSSEDAVAYEVMTGSVTYAGTTYESGSRFLTDGSTTATTGTGTFRLTIPPVLQTYCEDNKTCAFRDKILQTGDESTEYYTTGEHGYVGNNSQSTGVDNFYGTYQGWAASV